MDSDDAQLHPNWLALATVNFPRKRFVRGLELQSNVDSKVEINNSALGERNGEDVRKFYEETTKHSQRIVPATPPRVPNKSINPKKIPLLSFDRNTFFRLATTNNVTELARINYQAGDVDVHDTFGWTALMMAACAGAIDAVRILIQLGANKDIKEKTGRTARDFAIEKGYNHIASILATNVEANEELESQEVSTSTIFSVEPFYCSTCEHTFTDSTRLQHETSTVHQFSTETGIAQNKLTKFNISNKNRGLQLMVKQGWDKESGLGPTQTGRLYPVKTVIRNKRTGLGTKQEPARVTHFAAFDKQAVMHNRSSVLPKSKKRSRCDIRSEKLRDWKRERRLRKELS